MFIRSPIISVLGHVDHGKTTLLDKIRNTFVVQKESGGITQMIGVSYVKREEIERLAQDVKQMFAAEIKVPGLLFIDTPGHEAFTSLRERGGSIADLAILVIDINEGFKPQTVESIKILKQAKTPFVVAANKVDVIAGFNCKNSASFLKCLQHSQDSFQHKLDEKLYALMGQLSEHGFSSERFDRVKDFRKEVAIVPISAKLGVGVSELLLLITALSQKFMEKRLHLHPNEPAKGTVMEVSFEKGLGHAIDAIIYDGVLRQGDKCIFLTHDGPRVFTVKGVFEKEKNKLKPMKYVVAAAGVKLALREEGEILSGSPFEVIKGNEKVLVQKFQTELSSIIFKKEGEGVIVKADSIGSLEAILRTLEHIGLSVKSADIGKVNKKDVVEAVAVKNKNPLLGVIFSFNLKIDEDVKRLAQEKDVPIIASDVIYRLVDFYEEWKQAFKRKVEQQLEQQLPPVARVKVLKQYVFRFSKPVIFGVRVELGKIKPNLKLMDSEGQYLGEIRQIQKNKESVSVAQQGDEVALSCTGFDAKVLQRHDYLYPYLSDEDIDTWLNKGKTLLSAEQIQLLQHFKRKRLLKI